MMAEKARLIGSHDFAERVIASGNPGKAKQLGREVENLINRYGKNHVLT